MRICVYRCAHAVCATVSAGDSALRMISAEQGRAGHWELNETTWTGQKTVLAHVKSDCVVQVTSLPGDVVLARGCVPNQSSSTWYRVFNEHGAVLLKGSYDHFDAFQQADTDGSGTLFALATSHFEQPFSFVPQVRAGDFKNLAVNVYTASSGKLIFSTHLGAGSAEQHALRCHFGQQSEPCWRAKPNAVSPAVCEVTTRKGLE